MRPIHPEVASEYEKALRKLGPNADARESVRHDAFLDMVNLDEELLVSLCRTWDKGFARGFIVEACRALWRESRALDREGAAFEVTDVLISKYNALRDVYCDLREAA